MPNEKVVASSGNALPLPSKMRTVGDSVASVALGKASDPKAAPDRTKNLRRSMSEQTFLPRLSVPRDPEVLVSGVRRFTATRGSYDEALL